MLDQILIENEELKSKLHIFTNQMKESEHQLEMILEQNKILAEEKNRFQELCTKFEDQLNLREKELIEQERKKILTFQEKDIESEILKYKQVILFLVK